jgi:putative toxin-antitoxin system antitoxin component (TIGR02293 family)
MEEKNFDTAKKMYISSKSAVMKSKLYPISPNEVAKSSVVSDFLASYGTISPSASGFLGSWSSEHRLSVIRVGLPYSFVEVLALQSNIPVREVLEWLQLPQTTYNKRKRDNESMSRRDTELLLEIADALLFGLDAFNNEADKFLRWLKKPNLSLGGVTPLSCFDAITGVKMVRNALARLAYGNLA